MPKVPTTMPTAAVDVARSPGLSDLLTIEAIRIGAKAVWMQEEVINEKAAAKARKAGIFVVMNECILQEHMRRFR